jgi:benzylsuccinate CoA-transferase BbsF subunit
VVENFTPGTLDKIGLGYKDVSVLKPDIVMLSISSQGQTGPHSSVASYGPQLQALTGHVNLTGWSDRGPCQIDQSYPDFITPAYAVIALIGALVYRERTGKGQYIDCSNLEPSVQWVAPALLDYSANQHIQTRNGNKVLFAAPHNAYRCKGNDSWCGIAVTTEEEWSSLCTVIGKPELKGDPRFATLLDRKKNEEELDGIVSSWTAKYTAEEVMQKLQAEKVSAGKVQTFKDIFADPQLRHRNYFVPLNHPEMGVYEAYAPSYILSETPAELRLPAPCMGEHTELVCKELLKMSDEEFIELLGESLFE